MVSETNTKSANTKKKVLIPTLPINIQQYNRSLKIMQMFEGQQDGTSDYNDSALKFRKDSIQNSSGSQETPYQGQGVQQKSNKLRSI